MANFVGSTELQLETLNPTMRNFSCFPSRRSHLDSASYRTLVRIFSLCLDESLIPSQEPVKDPHLEESQSLSARKDPTSDRNGSEIRKDSSCGNPSLDCASNGNSVLAEELEHEKGRLGRRDDVTDESSVGELGDRKGNEEDERCVDGGIEKGVAFTESSLESLRNDNFDSLEQSEIDECVDMDLLGDILSDCTRLIDVQDNEPVNSELKEDMIPEDPKLDDSEDIILHLVDRLELGKRQGRLDEIPNSTVSGDELCSSSDELKQLEPRNHCECFNGESAKDLAFEKPTTVEAPDGSFKFQKEIREGMQLETHSYSEPLINCSVSSNLNEDMLDDGEIEEGEIRNEVGNSDQPLQFVHEYAVLEGQKLEEGSVYDIFAKNGNPNHILTTFSDMNPVDALSTRETKFSDEMYNTVICDSKQGINHASSGDGCLKPQNKKSCSKVTKADVKCQAIAPVALGLLEESSEKLAIKSKEKPTNAEAVDVRVKRKRGPLTEERKAKKKKAKKRKRAQKDREQGVKRLKLQPIVKPKAVKHCNFYLMGRCQQGDLCKFSHDTTPLTKSQPCKYFACDSCLKGDDCPFDHQLSKYPCHNYMSKGMCSRGVTCKFSHKLPIAEGSSPTSVISKSDSLLSPGKSNLRKQLNIKSTSLGASGPPKSTASSSQSIMHNPLEGNLVNSLKEPKRVPNGVRFLSFGKGPSDNANKQKDNLPLDKHDGIRICNQQNQEKLLSCGHKNAWSSGQKSLPVAQCETNMMSGRLVCRPPESTFAIKESKHSSFSGEPVGVPPRSLQNEVSEASKLLEEFLFCGGS